MTDFGARLASAWATHGRLCVGIDPHRFLLEKWELTLDADGCREFGYRVVDACAGVVGIVKPQVAFFERFGSEGFAALELVLARASEADLLTIADAKRGDIGSTMEGYAEAWLGSNSSLGADAVTVSPYLGVGALSPAFTLAHRNERGLFVLGVTSNPEARDLQASVSPRTDGTVAAQICREVSRIRQGDVSSCGLVLGAETNLSAYGIDPAWLSGVPILAPGFGTQGARVADAVRTFGEATSTLIVAQSRNVLDAGPAGIVESVKRASFEVADALS